MTTIASTKMTPTKFCELVENRLGYVPEPNGLAPWQRHCKQANLVARKIKTNPQLYTWANLKAAVELLARERTTRTPTGVFAYVERAINLRRDLDTNLELDIRQAVEVEHYRGDPDGWVDRLVRATGPYRQLVLDEYRDTILKSA